MSTLFTRIIRGDLPSEKVYETGSELAFLDINPKSEGHTLVVPKLEVAGFDALPTADLQSLIATVQLVTRGIIKAMGTPHYNIFLNNGAPAGQVIFHVHFHIVPRYQGGARSFRRASTTEGRLAEVGAEIRKTLQSLASTPA
ncbi:MAG: HIT family protein [SAR324 cluster bacterium]|nr:HIT family protein [SAR324 cluster bacterium]